MSDRRRPRLTLGQIFAVPVALGALSAIGLVAALVGDGLWDTASWPLLGLPVAVCVWYGWMVRRPPTQPSPRKGGGLKGKSSTLQSRPPLRGRI